MALFETVQRRASPAAWSQGVELARAGGVVGERGTDDEIVLSVLHPGAVKPFEVYLWPEDEDWSCGCRDAARDRDGRPCAHVAAAVIALKRTGEAGGALPKGANVARVGYRFRRERDPGNPALSGLSLERVLVRDGVDIPIVGTLTAISSGKRGPGTLLLTDGDLGVEDLLAFRGGRGKIARELAGRLLELLSEAPDLTLDGQPVRASGERMQPRGVVDDAEGGGFRLRLVRDRRIEEVFQNGIVRCGAVLHATGEGGMDAQQRQALNRGVHYTAAEVGRLVAEMLPRLRAKIQVDVYTKRLPTAGGSPPRLALEVTADGETLAVLPTLVYGDPPNARVDRGQLVLLGGPVPVRDEPAERKLIEALREGLGLTPGLRGLASGEGAVRLASRIQAFRDGSGRGVAVIGEAARRFERVGPLLPRVALDGERLAVAFQNSAGGEADPARVFQAWREGAELVPLLSGGWAPLPRAWLERHGHLLADLLAARDASGKVAKHAVFDLARLAAALDQPPPPTLAGLRGLVDDFSGLPDPVLPADLRADLRPYQRHGVAWLAFLRQAGLGGILADDMGLGKTLQALCVLGPGTLVVAPTSVLPNWAAEIRRFRPGLSVNLYHGPARRLDPNADLTLTTYALLRLDADALAARRWETVVLDEAQAIKNPDSQVARAAYRLEAGSRLTLTGTPVENRLDELWSQMHFLNPGLLGGRTDFQDRYARPIAAGTPGVAARLRTRLKPFLLRRLKRDVAPELPPRTDIALHCELSPSERAVYDTVRAATRKELVAKLAQGGGTLAALEALLRLRQAACHPSLVPGQRADSSSKVDLLLDTLDEALSEGHKALVFSQWTGFLDLVEPHLREAGIPFLRLDGSTRDRGAVVARFQDESGPPVMLISLRAGGVGLNLTAADHVFLLDPWWNPAVEEQAADRAHRIGQDRPVFVHRLVADGTVEERILDLQERKRSLAEAALGGADQAAAITRDELLALLA